MPETPIEDRRRQMRPARLHPGCSRRTALTRIVAGAVATLSARAAVAHTAQHMQGMEMPAPAAGADPAALAAERPFLDENAVAMDRMMADMAARPTGDIDADFVAMMIPHHQGAIDMARLQLKYGTNPALKNLAQEIVITQQEEIRAMRIAIGLPPDGLPGTPPAAPTAAAPDYTPGAHSGAPVREQPVTRSHDHAGAAPAGAARD